jgi:hypothetical protein
MTPEDIERLRVLERGGVSQEDGDLRAERHRLREAFNAAFPPSLFRVAWHEAGHAVVMHRLGHPPLGIGRDVSHDGQTVAPPTFPSNPWERVSRTVRVAGYLTEERACGPADLREAARIMDRFAFMGNPLDDRLRELARSEAEAGYILDANWGAVAAVAALVEASKWVNGDQIAAALRGVPCGDSDIREG